MRLRSVRVLVVAVTGLIASSCHGSGNRDDAPTSERTVRITVLTSTGCGGTEPAVEQVKAVAARLGISLSIDRVVVDSPADAERLHLLGSPTFLMNGRDLDASARDRTDFKLG